MSVVQQITLSESAFELRNTEGLWVLSARDRRSERWWRGRAAGERGPCLYDPRLDDNGNPKDQCPVARGVGVGPESDCWSRLMNEHYDDVFTDPLNPSGGHRGSIPDSTSRELF